MLNLLVTEATSARSYEDYEKLIEEAYIEPIRTVIVVDDEFPSLDGLIDKELSGARPWAGHERDAKRVREILSYCRNRPRPWLVDVHDGQVVTIAGEEKIAPYLHHSDLMILDFHLQGDAGTGDHAIRILRDLAKNDHFNMVIVYTKGEDGSVEPVLRQIALSLMTENESLSIPARPKADMNNALAEWEDSDADIEQRLMELITEQTYLNVRKSESCKTLLKLPEWNTLSAILETAPEKIKKIKPALWAKWLIAKKQDLLTRQFSPTDLGHVNWTGNEDLNWIRTDRLFVTVVNKSHAPNDLPDKLKIAIKDWKPSPHQLLMARMRAQMDERGVIAESGVLRDHFLQAGWMKQLFDGETIDRKQTLKNTVDRHWESLGDNLRLDIDIYAGKLAEHLDSIGQEEVFKRFFSKIDLVKHRDIILKRLNSHACMKSHYLQSHLMTGHIFSSGDDLWACLSPACDLIPGQKKTGWYGRLGNYLPFMAVHLHRVSDEKALKDANQNIFIFIDTGSHTGCYSFCPMGEIHTNPQWEQFFAKNNGRINEEGDGLTVGRLNVFGEGLALNDTEVSIVGQLRYEYALNLLQRLGTNLSRVGLDYQTAPILEEIQPPPSVQ